MKDLGASLYLESGLGGEGGGERTGLNIQKEVRKSVGRGDPAQSWERKVVA